ncbi:MAG: metallophosphoesterase [Myxococcota bacterium]
MTAEHNLLVISDLHLGEDLNSGPHAPPGSAESPVSQTERALTAFLVHYTAFRQEGLPWRLVCNGDMVDFLSVALSPEEAGIEGTEDDRTFGFGATCVAARAKLVRVIERHHAFFVALARFVGRGNEVHLVVGNHDAELHWEAVQADISAALDRIWQAETGSSDLVSPRVTFHPWFYYDPGVAWIEHGHQYDPFCSFEDLLAPEDPDNPQSLEENLGTAAMRYLGNHLPVNPDATADLSFVEYLHLIMNARHDDAFKFAGGYAAVVRALGSQWLKRFRDPEKFKARREQRKARMREIAVSVGLRAGTLERLHRLRRPPVYLDFLAFIRSVMLGRLLTTVALLALIPFLMPLLAFPYNVGFAFVGVVLVALIHVWLASGRDNVDPTEQMRKVAGKIRRIVRAPVVVFGHSHIPLAHRLLGNGWYFNTGSWAGGSERDLAFTHLVVLRRRGRVRSALCRWHAGESRELRAEESRMGPIGHEPELSAGY